MKNIKKFSFITNQKALNLESKKAQVSQKNFDYRKNNFT